ncbi:MAG TPA: hypothetical protein DDX89_03745 [Candidatus Omnitrophica bacterium]|nr:MAG: hypothetical protein A2Z92_03460 [Omnitrophica WOR_2 bacterium GWA2_63_20]OGX17834.1 MAG: hypothetical protein A2105_04990 [Omnitrophica WOR_2 bacterium GWF2_63_9]OGX35298.1 MAG: hypothetical protein A3B73_00390 [Omnitrophica WOR_2 bacterium RIFCSPHIGHO2_02_FULL_63_39]OGX44945.1 MAG: hypothetical protein A3I71_05360 [Omnitrophica WOR_2 bacterium RIFCSPLOWO2_02_FULL_63_16]OGX49354.1 MAG: hypothetical protein A3G88_00750 [Omnitrophica WOR_2 bacterium RIFCSPLOWO2_12_FULL_63_16]HAM40940.1 
MGTFYRLIGFFGVAIFVGLCVVTYLTHPELLPQGSVQRVERLIDQARTIQERVSRAGTRPHGSAPPIAKPSPRAVRTPSPAASANQVTLYLANGGMVTGELVRESAEGVTLRWDYGEVAFSREEVTRTVKGRQIQTPDDIVLPRSGGD